MGIGMCSVTLGWFRSYLSSQCQQVCIDGSLSNQRYLNCGAPQGSCLGPPLFVMYTSTLSRLFNVISPRLIVTQMIPSYTWVSSSMMLMPRMRFVCWIHQIRVDRSCIRTEKVADSKISGYAWMEPVKSGRRSLFTSMVVNNLNLHFPKLKLILFNILLFRNYERSYKS